MKIQDSVALVTGANRGLGHAFAEALLERGARKVYAAARDPATVKLTGVVPIRLDVTRPDTIAALANIASDVTLLVNNAGISKGGAVLGPDAIAKARAEIETNYIGPLAMSQAFAPILAKNGGGAILDVLSVLSWVIRPESDSYSASKAAAWALTNSLRTALAPQGTQVLGLHVGYMETDMTEKIEAPKESPAVVVRRALDALEAGASEVFADETSEKVHALLSRSIYLRPWPSNVQAAQEMDDEDESKVQRRSDVVPRAAARGGPQR